MSVTLVRSVLFGSLRLLVAGRSWDLPVARIRGAIDGLRGRLGVGGYAPGTNDPKAVRKTPA